MSFDILIIDDEKDIRDLVSGILDDEGYLTRSAGCCVEALESIKQKEPHLVILDVWLGESDKDGLRLLSKIKEEHQFIPVIMMSGHGTIETAVNAIKQGAYDFIEKPFDANRLILSIQKAIETLKLRRENQELKIKAKINDSIIGTSHSITTLRNEIEKIASTQGRCFIQGPSGSEKEEIAREIFKQSDSYGTTFTAVNCQTSNQKQLEIDLFGAEINSETKPIVKIGSIERSNGGTLYLEEISAISHDLQIKILKILKENKFSRIGSHVRISLKTRIISSSSFDINTLVKNNLFDSELYYRLSANTIKVPPISMRPEDIPLLLSHYMEQSARAYNIQPKKISKEAISVLTAYYWPGDVMQLRNLVDWSLVMSKSKKKTEQNSIIDVCDLPKEILEGKSFGGNSNAQFISFVSNLSIKEAREAFEREYFIEQLRKFSGNVSQTSKFVGMERSALHRKLKSLNIQDIKPPIHLEDN